MTQSAWVLLLLLRTTVVRCAVVSLRFSVALANLRLSRAEEIKPSRSIIALVAPKDYRRRRRVCVLIELSNYQFNYIRRVAESLGLMRESCTSGAQKYQNTLAHTHLKTMTLASVVKEDVPSLSGQPPVVARGRTWCQQRKCSACVARPRKMELRCWIFLLLPFFKLQRMHPCLQKNFLHDNLK